MIMNINSPIGRAGAGSVAGASAIKNIISREFIVSNVNLLPYSTFNRNTKSFANPRFTNQ